MVLLQLFYVLLNLSQCWEGPYLQKVNWEMSPTLDLKEKNTLANQGRHSVVTGVVIWGQRLKSAMLFCF